ncbi:prepilin-type N-terminal cleavage/methylation domain-containing protein [Cryobacterium sp. PH31-O1]|uniref:prepilin-type N-terminal cleavage/methylation domain-containing protein n=1 Tax=Cryobacterium sp. PH31-O1 TaxID=3046306 RepID=UPI0024B92F74|nr:prepilin-type N-terminal cleavage/methylation domain-containing protein [Cryobacterium sp. PH31-O1]MDJ0337774.1 prepilin-type N-terminal cleavage/methylation domain-containing protein [Cryobacterium sp. PH31-O1]
MTRWRTLRADNVESGLSLVELLVSVVLLGVCLVMISGLYVSATRSLGSASALGANTREASNGMNAMARSIRAATANPVASPALADPAIAAATNESLTLFAYVNLGLSTQQPVKIRLEVDAERRLVETRWPSVPLAGGLFSFASTPLSTRILAQTVAPEGSGPPLFSLTDSAGSILPLDIAPTPVQLRSIVTVTVNLTVQTSATDARSAVTLSNTVGMPNVRFAMVGP